MHLLILQNTPFGKPKAKSKKHIKLHGLSSTQGRKQQAEKYISNELYERAPHDKIEPNKTNEREE